MSLFFSCLCVVTYVLQWSYENSELIKLKFMILNEHISWPENIIKMNKRQGERERESKEDERS